MDSLSTAAHSTILVLRANSAAASPNPKAKHRSFKISRIWDRSRHSKFRQAFALATIRLWPCAEACDVWRAKINVSPHLCGFVKDVKVLPSKWFATHFPVVIDIDIQGPAIFAQKFRFPKQLVDFSVEKVNLNSHFIKSCRNNLLQLKFGENPLNRSCGMHCFKGTPHNIFQLLTRDDVSNPN